MAVTATRMANERLGGTSGRQKWLLTGTGTESTADARTALLSAVLAAGFSSWDTIALDTENIEVEEKQPNWLWIGTVPFRKGQGTTGKVKPETGDQSWQMSTGGGSVHITQALSTVNSYVAAGNAPDFDEAINVTPEGVQGVDINARAVRFSVTKYLAAASMTSTYLGYLIDQTNTVNNGNVAITFKDSTTYTFAAGELLLLNVTVTERPEEEDFAITFEIAYSPNETNITVGAITVTTKAGWDYLWVLYQETVSENRLVETPAAAYVVRVYEQTDWSNLSLS